VEWLSFNFINQNENSATVALEWEKIRISFTLKVDYEKTQLESFRKELRTEKGFIWQSWEQAAQFCLQRNINLDQALQWIDTATGPSFGGEKVFQPWATKAQILRKLGKLDESNKIIQKALPIGGIIELHQYARQLIMLKNPKEALEIFQYNYDKNPNAFTTIVGMARGLSSNGQYDKALKFANLALPLAPDPNNKASVETMIGKLKNNQDVN
jgi:tetratricopeptide (TPR) repeat protein